MDNRDLNIEDFAVEIGLASYAGRVTPDQLRNWIKRFGFLPHARAGQGRAMTFRFSNCVQIAMVRELAELGLDPAATCRFISRSDLVRALWAGDDFRFTAENGEMVQKAHYPRAFFTVRLKPIHDETLERFCEAWDGAYDTDVLRANYFKALAEARARAL